MCLLVSNSGPNKVLVVSGVGYDQPAFIKGGRVFWIPCFHKVSKLKLNIMTISVTSENVNSSSGVPVNIEGVAQVKVNADNDDNLQMACTHFLGMKERDINQVINETLEGHQRAVISLLTVEEIFQDRIKFSEKVRETVHHDLMKIG